MLYDNIYYVGCLCQAFLRDHPDILDSVRSHNAGANDAWGPAANPELSSRLLAWLGRRSSVTEMAHHAMLLYLADVSKVDADIGDPFHALVAAAS